MQKNKELTGHASAFGCAIIWGTTFIASKFLLTDFSSLTILVLRFLIAFTVLFLLHPKMMKTKGWKEELWFALAGLSGVTLCYAFEIMALSYTSVSNVGILVSVSPFFTAVFSKVFLKENSISKNFFLGFMLALAGIFLISTQGDFSFRLNIFGDLLALLSAICWSAYSLISNKVSSFGYNNIVVTRRIFFYGLLFVLPVLLFTNADWNLQAFTQPQNLFSMLYLAVGASSLCFLLWNNAIEKIGVLRTSTYIYLLPIISILASALLLGESITLYSVVGITLILVGLSYSEKKQQQTVNA